MEQKDDAMAEREKTTQKIEAYYEKQKGWRPFDIREITDRYEKQKGWRELGKWFFAIATFGFGALWLLLTTSIVKEGEIGLRRNFRGEMTLLPPGRHSNFPWEEYPVQPQS